MGPTLAPVGKLKDQILELFDRDNERQTGVYLPGWQMDTIVLDERRRGPQGRQYNHFIRYAIA